MAARTLSLTPEMVEGCHRIVPDPGPSEGLTYLNDDDYDEMIEAALRAQPDPSAFWLFAYGSLIWKPEIENVEERVATAAGWHRSFCIKLTRFRGSEEQPGLMMGLDRGGQCRGVALRLPSRDPREQLGRLFRREMTGKPTTYLPRWVKLRTDAGPICALGFTINRSGRSYAGRLSDGETARVLAAACGHWGSGADYLYNTVANLESRGIHDTHLWRLQEMVAREIQRRNS